MTDPRTTEPDMIEVMDAHWEAYFQKFHAPIIGLINSYDSAKQLADVQVVVRMRVEGEDIGKPYILRGVSVCWPAGGGISYTMPLVPGNPIELIPQDADVGAYLASGSVDQLPQSTRRFSLSDALGFPLAARAQGASLPATAFAADGGVLAGKHYLGGSDATDWVAMAVKTKAGLDTIIAAFNAHMHATAATGPPVVPTPIVGPPITIPIPVAGSVESTLIKVK